MMVLFLLGSGCAFLYELMYWIPGVFFSPFSGFLSSSRSLSPPFLLFFPSFFFLGAGPGSLLCFCAPAARTTVVRGRPERMAAHVFLFLFSLSGPAPLSLALLSLSLSSFCLSVSLSLSLACVSTGMVG